jgi:inositol-phosphate phosphatase/L-galactose 1-phosphate phosphatase/histidinol-phosphatase
MPGRASAAELEAAAALAPALADAAGAVIRRYFRQRVEIIDKADASPVTIADRDSETAMRQLISARFPDHGIIGEEFGEDRPDAEFVWVLDPIDGTKSFISGVPMFGTLIGLLHQGVPVLGVLDQPILRERWLGVQGSRTIFNDAPISTRPCAALAAATLFTTAPEIFDADEIGRFQKVQGAAKLIRYGIDCYAYGLVASGFIDAVIEAQLNLYDFCAHIPIIEGAGGIVTDWRGQRATMETDGRIVACGDARLHEEMLRLIA